MKIQTKTLLQAINKIDFDKSIDNPLRLLSIQTAENKLKLS